MMSGENSSTQNASMINGNVLDSDFALASCEMNLVEIGDRIIKQESKTMDTSCVKDELIDDDNELKVSLPFEEQFVPEVKEEDQDGCEPATAEQQQPSHFATPPGEACSSSSLSSSGIRKQSTQDLAKERQLHAELAKVELLRARLELEYGLAKKRMCLIEEQLKATKLQSLRMRQELRLLNQPLEHAQ